MIRKIISSIPLEIIAILLIIALPVAVIMIASNKIGSLVVPQKTDASPSTLSISSSPSPTASGDSEASSNKPDDVLGTQTNYQNPFITPVPTPSSSYFQTPTPSPYGVPQQNVIIYTYPSPSPRSTSPTIYAPQLLVDPDIEDVLAELRETLNRIGNEPVAMNVIQGRKQRAYQDWINNNQEIYAAILGSRYINDLNTIRAIHGL